MKIVLYIHSYIKNILPLLSTYNRWVDLLPKLLSTIGERQDISVGSREMTGDEYRYQVLKEFCDCDWSFETALTLLLVIK